jgi:hypothetical protein
VQIAIINAKPFDDFRLIAALECIAIIAHYIVIFVHHIAEIYSFNVDLKKWEFYATYFKLSGNKRIINKKN